MEKKICRNEEREIKKMGWRKKISLSVKIKEKGKKSKSKAKQAELVMKNCHLPLLKSPIADVLNAVLYIMDTLRMLPHSAVEAIIDPNAKCSESSDKLLGKIANSEQRVLYNS